jgi:hypothetical protein
MITANEFWNWFIENQHPYLFIHNENMQDRDDAMENFTKKLHEFNEGLYFLIGGSEGGPQELIITAEGVREYFPKVEELVNAAPEIEGWKILAFKPAMDTSFGIRMGDMDFSPETLWFMPLKHPDHPEYLGLHIGIPEYDEKHNEHYLQIAFLLIDNLIGEKRSSDEIQYIETGDLPDLPGEKGFYPLTELGNFLEWKKGKG